jgi:hypothetical protein
MKHFDEVIEKYKSKDIVTHNKSLDEMGIFYVGDLLDYIKQKEGVEFAFDVARSLAQHLQYKYEGL